MNPFTRFLRSLSPPAQAPEIEEFVARWDVVEAVVVAVYKNEPLPDELRAAYPEARAWLLAQAPRWQPRLAPHWKQALQGGRPAPSDPFEQILKRGRSAGDFAGDWEAMQALGAAREALNRYLLTLR